jgi:hypothetical protein
MMDLLKAYAHQVVSYHPVKQRDELFAEIYDELCEEFGDRQAENPGLTEVEFLNGNRRHPVKYATQLASDSSPWLIGPQFYFSFLSALKIALAIVVVMHVALAAVTVLTGTSLLSALWGMLGSIAGSLLWVGASVLGVFVAMEKSGERATWLDKWDASELKPADSHDEISRFETSFDLGLSTFGLLWVLDVVNVPAVVRHDGEWITSFSVNLPGALWLIAGLLLAFGIVFSLYRLVRRLWTPLLRMVTISDNVAWLVLLAFVASSPELLSVEHEGAAEFLGIIEKAFKGSLLIAMVIIAWDTLTHAWRLLRGLR